MSETPSKIKSSVVLFYTIMNIGIVSAWVLKLNTERPEQKVPFTQANSSFKHTMHLLDPHTIPTYITSYSILSSCAFTTVLNNWKCELTAHTVLVYSYVLDWLVWWNPKAMPTNYIDYKLPFNYNLLPNHIGSIYHTTSHC